jgi:hypothetical protein
MPAELGTESAGFRRKCKELGWLVLEELAPLEESSGARTAGTSSHQWGETSSSNGTSYRSIFGIEGSGALDFEQGQWWGLGKAYQRTAF